MHVGSTGADDGPNSRFLGMFAANDHHLIVAGIGSQLAAKHKLCATADKSVSGARLDDTRRQRINHDLVMSGSQLTSQESAPDPPSAPRLPGRTHAPGPLKRSGKQPS